MCVCEGGLIESLIKSRKKKKKSYRKASNSRVVVEGKFQFHLSDIALVCSNRQFAHTFVFSRVDPGDPYVLMNQDKRREYRGSSRSNTQTLSRKRERNLVASPGAPCLKSRKAV